MPDSISIDLAQVPPGTRRAIDAFGTTIAVFNVSGMVFAVDNQCPHRQGPLCYGRLGGTTLPSEPYEFVFGLEDRILTCPWHHWQFHLETGEAVFDPLVQAPTYEAGIEGDRIVIHDTPRKQNGSHKRPAAGQSLDKRSPHMRHEEPFTPHPDAQLIRDYMDAWAREDLDAVRDFYSDDIVFHFPGRSRLAGTYRGKKEFFDDYGAKLAEMGTSPQIIEVHDVLASDDHAAILVRERYEREGKEPLNVNRIGLYQIEDGKIVELWVHDQDQYATDAFFS